RHRTATSDRSSAVAPGLGRDLLGLERAARGAVWRRLGQRHARRAVRREWRLPGIVRAAAESVLAAGRRVVADPAVAAWRRVSGAEDRRGDARSRAPRDRLALAVGAPPAPGALCRQLP